MKNVRSDCLDLLVYNDLGVIWNGCGCSIDGYCCGFWIVMDLCAEAVFFGKSFFEKIFKNYFCNQFFFSKFFVYFEIYF